jgi:hypothetical protein
MLKGLKCLISYKFISIKTLYKIDCYDKIITLNENDIDCCKPNINEFEVILHSLGNPGHVYFV